MKENRSLKSPASVPLRLAFRADSVLLTAEAGGVSILEASGEAFTFTYLRLAANGASLA